MYIFEVGKIELYLERTISITLVEYQSPDF